MCSAVASAAELLALNEKEEGRLARSDLAVGHPCTTACQSINVISAMTGEHLCSVSGVQDLSRLKSAVAKAAGVPEWQQLLISDGQPLQHGIPLCSMSNMQDCTVLLLRKSEAAMTMDKMMDWHLKHTIDKSYLNDRSFMLAAVKASGAALKYASSDMQKDPEFVLVAVKTSGAALQFADMELRQNYEFMLSAVEASSSAISFASTELLRNMDFLLDAARTNCDVIGFVCHMSQVQWIRKDKVSMLSIVRVHGSALRFASPELRKDKEVVIAALRADPHAVRFCPVELQRDADIRRILSGRA